MNSGSTEKQRDPAARFSVFTSTVPGRLTKRWHLGPDGQPVKESGGQMVRGHVHIAEAGSVEEFAAFLKTLGPDQALTYGIPSREGAVVTYRAWIEAGKPPDLICRTKSHLRYPDGPGVLFLDYDPRKNGGKTMDRDGLIGVLEAVCPHLAECGVVHWYSSGSWIINERTGETVRGEGGQRIYIIVENAVDIPAAGDRLQTLLWAHGHGYFEISAAGSLLCRTPFDASVLQPNRFDFAAGACCEPPLVQRRGEPFVRPGRRARLLSDIPEPSPSEIAIARHAMDTERSAIATQAAVVRQAHVARLAQQIAGEGASPEQIHEATNTVLRAMDGGTLSGKYRISVLVDGQPRELSVAEILDKPGEYHGCDTHDPVEPGYDGGRPVGRLFLNGAIPRLYSFAHGGRTFLLMRAPVMIEVAAGRESEVDEKVLEAMRKSFRFYEYGGILVQMVDGRIHLVDEYGLLFWMRINCAFFTRRVRGGVAVDTPVPAPIQVARVILAIGRQRRLPVLRAIITAQTITPDGNVISEPGYNESTQLFLHADDDSLLPVPEAPGLEEAQAAAERIMRPFRHFPYVGPMDRSIMLAAILSAVVRPTIDTCPGFGFDAPVQGSGKTLQARGVCAIATGLPGNIKPHVGGRDDEEIRKRILSILIEGLMCVIWDNITGILNSEALAALLTSTEYSDRLLGKSRVVTAPNTALWLFTGNNMQLAGDMPRRIFRCRIDPRTEEPFAREFDFDPVTYCLQRRHEIVRDAITIIKAWISAGRPMAPGRTASFENWDTLVRQPIAWLAAYDVSLVDPLDAMREGQADDPELAAWGQFLETLIRKFESKEFVVRDVYAIYDKVDRARRSLYDMAPVICSEDEVAIFETIHDELGAARAVTAKRIGRFFLNRQDRLARGMRLVRVSKDRDGARWAVHADRVLADRVLAGGLGANSKSHDATQCGGR